MMENNHRYSRRASWLIALFLFYNNHVASKQIEIDLQAHDLKVIQFESTQKTITLSLDIDGKRTQKLEKNSLGIKKGYFLVRPSAGDKKLTITSSRHEGQVTFNEFSAKSPQDIEMLLNSLQLFDSLTLDKHNLTIKPIEELTVIADFPSLDESIESFIRINLAEWFIKKKEFKQAIPHVLTNGVDTDSRILLQCYILKKMSADQVTLNTKEAILALAELGETLILRFRHKGEIKTIVNEVELSKKIYEEKCNEVISLIASKSKKERVNLYSKSWNSIDEAKMLLDYALWKATEKKDAPTISQVIIRMWHYFNAKRDGNNEGLKLIKHAGYLLETYNGYENEKVDIATKASVMLKRLGKYGENQHELGKGFDLIDKITPDMLENLLFSAGFLYRQLGEYDLSERYFHRALESYKHKNNSLFLDRNCSLPYISNVKAGKIMVQIGFLNRKKEEFEKAELYIECAISFLSEQPENYLLAAFSEKAKLLVIQKKYAQAATYAHKILNDRPYPVQRMESLLILIQINLFIKDFEKAKVLSNEMAKSLGYGDVFQLKNLLIVVPDYPAQQIEMFRLLGWYSNLTHNYKQANHFFEKAIELLKKFGKNVNLNQAWRAASYNLVETYIDHKMRQSKNEKAQNLESIVNILENHYSLDPNLEKELYSINIETEENDLVASKLFDKWMLAENQLLAANDNALPGLREQADITRNLYLGAHHLKEKFISKNLEKRSLESLQSKMQNDEVILRYVINKKQSFVLEITRNNIDLRHLPPSEEIHALINSLLSDTNVTNWELLKFDQLVRELIPLDKIKSKGYKKLLVIPDSILHQMPFSAINISENNERYVPLSNKIEVIRIYSISSYYSKLQSQKTGSKKKFAIFAASKPIDLVATNPQHIQKVTREWLSTLNPIPAALDEANYIKNKLDNFDVILGIGENATKSFLLSDSTRQANIIHIATHGLFNSKIPDIVGLMTNDQTTTYMSSFITLNELLSQPFSSELVVVSGCNTMLGKFYKGSGMRSLTRGFLAQGAGSVLGTLWAVPDRSTAKFMSSFYDNLVQLQGNVSAALNLTKKQFSRSGRYRHPKYWAGFVLTSSNKQYESIDLTSSKSPL